MYYVRRQPINVSQKRPESRREKEKFTSTLGLRMDMVDVNSFVTYVEEFKVLICRTCRHGLAAKGVSRHFQWRRKLIPIEVRKRIVEFAARLDLKEAEEVKVPTGEVPAIEGLNVVKGFECEECHVLYGRVRSMEDHCRTRHGWQKSKGIYDGLTILLI